MKLTAKEAFGISNGKESIKNNILNEIFQTIESSANLGYSKVNYIAYAPDLYKYEIIKELINLGYSISNNKEGILISWKPLN